MPWSRRLDGKPSRRSRASRPPVGLFAVHVRATRKPSTSKRVNLCGLCVGVPLPFVRAVRPVARPFRHAVRRSRRPRRALLCRPVRRSRRASDRQAVRTSACSPSAFRCRPQPGRNRSPCRSRRASDRQAVRRAPSRAPISTGKPSTVRAVGLCAVGVPLPMAQATGKPSACAVHVRATRKPSTSKRVNRCGLCVGVPLPFVRAVRPVARPFRHAVRRSRRPQPGRNRAPCRGRAVSMASRHADLDGQAVRLSACSPSAGSMVNLRPVRASKGVASGARENFYCTKPKSESQQTYNLLKPLFLLGFSPIGGK